MAAALALMVSDRLAWAGVVAGLATSAKYPGRLPARAAGRRRLGAGGGASRISIGLGALAFLATSPFVLVHPGQAWSDASRVQRLARDGWLGFEHDSFALFSFTGRFWHTLGPALIVGVSSASSSRPSRARRPDLILALLRRRLRDRPAHDPRALRPLPAAARACPGGARRPAALARAGDAAPARDPADVLDPKRRDADEDRHARRRRALDRGARARRRHGSPPSPRRRRLPGEPSCRCSCPGPGRPSDPNRDVARLRSEGIQYVLVTGAVADRVLAARSHYPARRALLRSTSARNETSLLCEGARRPCRPLGCRLPAVDEEAHTRIAPAPRRRRAGRVRLRRRHRHELEGGEPQARRADLPGRVEGRLAAAREQDPRGRLLPLLGALAADGEDQRRRRLLRRRRPRCLRREGQELPRQHGLAGAGDRRGARQLPRLSRPRRRCRPASPRTTTTAS